MGWFASLGVAVLAGALGLLLGGWVMARCVRWYRVSGFEGKAGYAIVGMALVGGLVGFVLGLVVALLVPAEASVPFLRALGIAWGSALALALLAALVARLLADVPPTLDGRELVLEVELRLPVDVADLPALAPEAAYVELGALRGRVRRAARRGPLRLAEARREGGRWIVPGSAPVWTGRGKRLLTAQLGDAPTHGFLVPLPRRPGRAHLAWSGWLPHPRPSEPPWPDTRASFRFRVRPDEPDAAPDPVP